MAYYSRSFEGIFWSQKKSRTHHICLGKGDCDGIRPGALYWERRTRVKGRPAKYCYSCGEAKRAEEKV